MFFLPKKEKKKKEKKENLAYYLCIPMYPLFLEWEKLFGTAIHRKKNNDDSQLFTCVQKRRKNSILQQSPPQGQTLSPLP